MLLTLIYYSRLQEMNKYFSLIYLNAFFIIDFCLKLSYCNFFFQTDRVSNVGQNKIYLTLIMIRKGNGLKRKKTSYFYFGVT